MRSRYHASQPPPSLEGAVDGADVASAASHEDLLRLHREGRSSDEERSPLRPYRDYGADGPRMAHTQGRTDATAASSPATPPRDTCGWLTLLFGPQQSRNVPRTILFNFLDGACYSVWGALLLPVLMGKVSGDAAVGTAAAAAGVAQLVAATLAGYGGDRVKRQTLVRLGAVFGLASVAIFFAAVQLSARTAESDVPEANTSSTPPPVPAVSSASQSSASSSSSSHASGSAASDSDAAGTVSDLRWRLTSLFIAAQTVWGVYTGLVSTCAEALFADSVPSGERTGIYNIKWMVQTLCYVVGYTAALLMLLTLGNDWRLSSVRLVMSLGLLAHPVALLVLFLLRDRDALSQAEGPVMADATPEAERDSVDAILAANQSSSQAATLYVAVEEEEEEIVGAEAAHATTHANDAKQETTPSDRPSPVPAIHDEAAAAVSERRTPTRSPNEQAPIVVGEALPDTLTLPQRIARELAAQEERHVMTRASHRRAPLRRLAQDACFYLCSWRAVPYLVCLVDFLMALGSGMTLLYFPLFFKNVVGVTPVLMYVTYLTSTCLTAATSHLARVLAERWLQRIPAVMLVRTVGTTFLLLLGVIPVFVNDTHQEEDGSERLYQPRRRPGAAPIFLSLFLFRQACMNAVAGITRSVIMDAVPKESRAKWSAFESVSSFTWAGSAMVGGYLVQARGYQFNFTVTAVFHLSAGLLLLPAAMGARRVERILKEEA